MKQDDALVSSSKIWFHFNRFKDFNSFAIVNLNFKYTLINKLD